ncbi:MAG: ACP S-malonyltransferase [Tissierellia bacterium]|nr:ACP S-malonyltransferase [Tissierellia bacterium]
MGKVAFIFPGQGAQFVGMGKDFYESFKESRLVFEEANDSLNMDLKSLCFEGTEEELMKTENTQPAILATSVAIMKALEREGIDCDYTAGLSLGEYTALVKSGGIKLSDALKLVKIRGKLMQEAVPQGIGGMAAILGLEREKVKEAIEEVKDKFLVEIANYNSPEQIVISGIKEGVEIACKKALELGAKKAIILPVSAPFHSSLLEPAGKKLKEILEETTIFDLEKDLISNVDAKPVVKKDEVKEKLVKQVSSSVLWQDSVEFLIDENVDTFIEIGPGKSLTGFVKRISKSLKKDVKAYHVNNIDSFNKTVSALRKEGMN